MASRPETSPGFLLWQVTLRWQRVVAAALAPFDLTHVQFVLLVSVWWLNAQGSEPNQLAVATHAGTDVKMTSQVLRKLADKGLLERAVDTADTRARRLRVTPAGRRAAEQAVRVVEAVDAEFFAAAGDVPTLTALLRPLAGPTATSARRRPRPPHR